MFYGNSSKDWLIALAIAAGSIVVSRLFYFISTKGIKPLFAKAKSRFMYLTIDMLEEPLAMLIFVIGFYTAQRRLSFAASVDATVDKAAFFAVILIITWAISRFLNDFISEYIVPIVEKSDSKLDDQLLPILRKAVSIIVWLLGIIIALDNIGYDVGTIVAGLGIGGLAFAFAAQETIANIFGGLTVFFDAPFRIGDRVKIDGYDGWVREIGLRSARIETLDGRMLTMPNSYFSKTVIENVTSEPATRICETIGLACDQSSAVIEKAIDLLKDLLAKEPNLTKTASVSFKDIGDSSWNVSVIFWIKKDADYGDTLSHTNLSMVKAFEKAGIEFSLPVRQIVQSK